MIEGEKISCDLRKNLRPSTRISETLDLMHFTLSDKQHIRKKKPKLKVNIWEVGCSAEFKMLAISVVGLTFDCCWEFGVSVASRIKLSWEQHIQHHHTPSNFIDGQCFVPKMSAFNIASTFSFYSCTSFWQNIQMQIKQLCCKVVSSCRKAVVRQSSIGTASFSSSSSEQMLRKQ